MQFFPRNEEALANEYKRDQKQSTEDSLISWLFLNPGVTEVRILPPYSKTGKFFKEYKEHAATKEGKFSPIPCGRQFNVPCAFCNEGEKFFHLGGEDNIKTSREFKPRQVFLWNVIVISTPDGKTNISDGVKVMKTGVMVKRDILDMDQDMEAGFADITNPEGGINLRITRQGQGRLATTYTVKPTQKRTSLEDLLGPVGGVSSLNLYNLDDIIFVPSEEDLVRAFSETNAAPGFDAAPASDIPITVPDLPSLSTVEIPEPPQAKE